MRHVIAIHGIVWSGVVPYMHRCCMNPLQTTSGCGLTKVDSIHLNRHCAVMYIRYEIIQFIECALGFNVKRPLVKKGIYVSHIHGDGV